MLAAVITQFPFVEKIITPYILLLVTTPMIALVPLLVQKMGFGLAPRIIAVALAAGPMVMINSATGFRRTDLAKIALARSYGAITFQIFTKVRFPLALPMIIVGLMVGAIFGMLTAVGAEIVGSSEGLGNRLAFYSSRIQMADFWAVIVILAIMGILIYVFFYLGRQDDGRAGRPDSDTTTGSSSRAMALAVASVEPGGWTRWVGDMNPISGVPRGHAIQTHGGFAHGPSG